MRSFVDYFLQHNLFVNLLSIIVLVVGGWIIFNMSREAFPNVEYDIVTITTIWPGASSRDVERLITNSLEESIEEVDGIKDYRSSSIESRSGIIITIEPDVGDTQNVVDDIRSAMERTEDLPDDAEKPLLAELTTSRLPVIQWALLRSKAKDGSYIISYKKFRDIAETLKNRFMQLDGVARVSRRGWRDAEIFVDLIPRFMRQYLIGGNDVIQALKNRNVSLPGGDIQLDKEEIIVRTVGEFNTAEEISKVPIRANEIGASVKVRDIAYVYEDFSEPVYLESTQNTETIGLTVVKRESADIIDVVDQTHRSVKKFQSDLPPGIEIVAVNDYSYFVRRRLGVLLSNGLIGLALVIGVLFLFLGWRTALMVALGIPISFGIAFVVMSYTGTTLNLISMFGLIIVLGIIVDDAIIVSENFYRYVEAGVPPMEAASKGTTEVFAPVMATVATTMAAFGPMLFMTGIFGKFVFTIPFVVILCLIGSLFECFVILPSHLYDMNRKIESSKLQGRLKERSWFNKLRVNYYEPILRFGLDHKGLSLCILLAMLILAFALQAVFGKFKLFPSAIDILYVKVETPIGTSKDETQRFVLAVGDAVKRIPDSELDQFISRVGIQGRDGNDPFTKRGSNYGMLLVYLHPEVDRKYSADVIIAALRKQTQWLLQPQSLQALNKKTVPEAARQKNLPDTQAYIPPQYEDLKGQLLGLEFEKLAGGPPVGKAIAIEILGKDFSNMQKIAGEYKELLSRITGVKNIGDDFLPGKEEIHVKVNQNLAAQANVSVVEVAAAINTGFEGTVATSIRRPDEEVDIRVRFAKKYRNSLNALKQVSLTNKQGNLITVSRLSSFQKEKSVTAINHLDGRRLITVTANVDEKLTSSSQVVKEVRKMSKGIPSRYPLYTIQFGGENRDTEESLASLQRSFLVGLLIIFMILASLFRSLLQPFIILLAIPFALIGVILAFLLHGEPFSFMAFMGLIGLAGVVINDSIVLVDFANRIKKERPELSNKEAALRAGSMRLRAVLLTTLTTVGGLLPTAYGLGGYDPFLVPMALSFAWGLIFSTVLILGIVPILYNLALDLHNWHESKFALGDIIQRLTKRQSSKSAKSVLGRRYT